MSFNRAFTPSPALLVAAALLISGCATRAPQPADGPPLPPSHDQRVRPPPDFMQVPDARPAIEPIRPGGPNKPYEVLGESYTPLPAEARLNEQGLASWYGRKFHGRRTASGEVYDMYAMTAAHRTLPLPSFARVSNPANGRSVIVRINDRGPFVKGRIVDLSYTAAQKLGVLGVATVELVRITPDEIRRGAWQRNAPSAAPLIESDDPPASIAASATPALNAGRGFWVQLGAFRDRQSAEQLQGQAGAAVEGLAPLLSVFSESGHFRVQAGPFASRDEAERATDLARAKLRIVAVLIQRR